jgi:hypothetical protein
VLQQQIEVIAEEQALGYDDRPATQVVECLLKGLRTPLTARPYRLTTGCSKHAVVGKHPPQVTW